MSTNPEIAAAEPAEDSRAGRETQRDKSARQRDVTAGSRDLAADARDRAANDDEEALLLTEHAHDSTIRALVSAGGAVRDQAAADVGGDEFLCGFTNTEIEAARRRVGEIRTALQQAPASISVGLAALGERDTLAKLIARADADMYAGKQGATPATRRRQAAGAGP